MTTTNKSDDLLRVAPGMKALLVASASVFALALSPAVAQDTTPSDDDVEVIEEADEDEDDGDTVVVTGSRIKRDTFSSIAPLQVITTDASLDVGLIDPSSILQQSESAAGQQIDATFQGFVLDNGPGSQTLNLRGLGANRTLLLINGRRFAPTGVEGAPSNPSLNLLPGSLIQQYDLLLDGASSVYGSDAVAGVGNIILRQDFEGLELFATGNYNQQGAGHDYTISGAWGKNTDRGFFGIGVEYDVRDEVTRGDRDFLAGCNTHYEIDENGVIRTVGISDKLNNERDFNGNLSAKTSPCKTQGLAGRFIERGAPGFGSVYYIPGQTNIGIPNFNESSLFGVPVDGDGDGIADVFFPDFSINGNDLEASLFSGQERISTMAYGEYTFEGDMNLTPFFEAMYVTLDVEADSGAPQLFPYVPADNPFNPCNPNQPNGVDCGLAEDSLLTDPGYLNLFEQYYNGGPGSANCFGLPAFLCTPATFGLLNGPVGPSQVQIVAAVDGDRDNTNVTLQQTRFVGGLRGDLPMFNSDNRFFQLNDWTFELSGVYSRGEGDSSRRGIRDDRLAFALGWDPTLDTNGNGITDDVATNNPGTLVALAGGACDAASVANPALLTADLTDGCVAFNSFSPSLYEGVQGSFASQAEADYLFDSRDVNTVYTQTVLNGFITGNLFSVPAGDVAAVMGFEYRKDEIDTSPDLIASNGLFFGFFSDLGAKGEKDIREAFFELDIPVLANKPLAKQLDFNASARWTEEEFYGAAWTYSLKAGWRPIDPLLLKASFGTSFRAPNLRENFLAGTTGFSSVFDPCAVPDEAFDINGVYNSSLDPRRQTSPQIFDTCVREGRDPLTVGRDVANGNSTLIPSVEIRQGGSLDLKEETSDSFTMGAAFEQPWFDSFDLNLNVNFYDIEIENTVISPSAGFIANNCFLRDDGVISPFCSRLTYNDPLGLISNIDAGFINQDKETVSGLDYNLAFSTDFDAFGQPFDLGFRVRANQLKERDTIFVGDDGTVSLSSFDGEFGFPEWTGNGTVTLDWDKYRVTWNTRYIGDVEQDANGIDDFDDVFGGSDTCGGPTVGDVLCRDVGFADAWTESSMSLRYQGDTWLIRAGITNLFDKTPPLVDSSEVFAISNIPIGNGYSLNGREYFLTMQKDFN